MSNYPIVARTTRLSHWIDARESSSGACLSTETASGKWTRPDASWQRRQEPAPGEVSLESAPQHAFEVRLSVTRALRNLAQHSTYLTFAKAEATQRGEGLGLRVGNERIRDVSVVAAVGVSEPNTGRNTSRDGKLPAMGGTVMRAAKGDEVVGLISAALGAELDVVKV
jgi:hypothetical protein